MKLIILATFLSANVAAQALSDCAQRCLDNMATIASSQLQCASDDINCFCTKSNWAYGVRDCANQACTTAESAEAVEYAYAQCAAVASDLSASTDTSTLLATTSSAALTSATESAATGTDLSPLSSSGRLSSGFDTQTSTTQSTSDTSTKSGAASSPTIPSSTSATDLPDDGGLSTGAKAGIGVAVPIVVIFLAGVIYLLWRRRKSRLAGTNTRAQPPAPSSGLMTAAYEDSNDLTKPELDNTAIAMKPELDSNTARASTPPPPVYTHHHQQPSSTTPSTHAHHEMPLSHSPALPRSELANAHAPPFDVGPAIVMPSPHRDEEARLEQLRKQRDALMRERQRMEEIDRIRAEEERLNREIAELEGRRY